ncbi:MAG: hypothetical protein BroJett022_11670 [Actinomycetes bacterium]|nr:MAG: hypothetical protein BroJett022_11670 [Actinomycetes bacterium]
MRRGVARILTTTLGAALALSVLLPAGAAAIVVGPNLGANPPNANFDCRSRPSVIGPQFFGFPDNCTYLGTSADVGRTTQAPFGGGVVTAVRVRAAAPVGPMQATVVRAIGSTTAGVTCCFHAGESQLFTPRANATSNVRVRLPVAHYIDVGAGIQVVDYIGLTVRANGVAIPGRYPGGGFEGSLAFFPRLTAADNVAGRVDGYGNSLVPLVNAEITPLCGGARARPPAARAVAGSWPDDAALPPPRTRAGARGGRCLGGVSIRDGTVGGSSARVPLDCNLVTRCRGKLTLLPKRGGGKLGSSKFKVEPGARKRVGVRLTKAGRRAARGDGSLTVRVKAKVAGGPDASAKVELRR